MPDTVVILLAAQLVLMLALVIGLFAMGRAARESIDKANALMEELRNTLENDLKPTVNEARKAIAKAEEAAILATGALSAAAPAVDTVSRLAGVVQRSVSPLWMDAAKLAFGLFGAIRSRNSKPKVESKEGEPTHVK